MINIVKKDGITLTDEILTNTTVMYTLLDAATRMCNKTSRMFDARKLEVNLYHQYKKSFNEALRYLQLTIYHLNNAFDGAFVAIHRDSAERASITDGMAVDMIKTALLYISRTDADISNREKIKNLIRQIPGTDLDIEGLLKIYDMQVNNHTEKKTAKNEIILNADKNESGSYIRPSLGETEETRKKEYLQELNTIHEAFKGHSFDEVHDFCLQNKLIHDDTNIYEQNMQQKETFSINFQNIRIYLHNIPYFHIEDNIGCLNEKGQLIRWLIPSENGIGNTRIS